MRRAWRIVAVVAVATAAACSPSGGGGDADAPSTTADATTTTTAGTPAVEAVGLVALVEDDGAIGHLGGRTVGVNALRFEQVNGIAATPFGLVAVGEELSRDRDPNPSPSEPRLWTSPDGRTWAAHDVGRVGSLRGVASTPDGAVVVGSIDGDDVVLRSDDGDGWESEVVPGAYLLAGVVVDGSSEVVVGLDGAGGRAWARDGDRWRPLAVGIPGGELRGACIDGDRVVVVGIARPGAADVPQAFRSDDGGGTWQQLFLPKPPSEQGSVTANDCALRGDELAMIGTVAGRFDRALLLASTDAGATWTAGEVEPRSGDDYHTLGRSVAVTARGWYAVGHDSSGDPSADVAMWSSPDLAGWVDDPTVRLAGAGPGTAEARNVSPGPDGTVLAGGTMGDQAIVLLVDDVPASPPARVAVTLAPVEAGEPIPAAGGVIPGLEGVDPCGLLGVDEIVRAAGGQVGVDEARVSIAPYDDYFGCTWAVGPDSPTLDSVLFMVLTPDDAERARTEAGYTQLVALAPAPAPDPCGGTTLVAIDTDAGFRCGDLLVVVESYETSDAAVLADTARLVAERAGLHG